MSDEGARMIARAIRFLALALVNAVVFYKVGKGRQGQELIDKTVTGTAEL